MAGEEFPGLCMTRSLGDLCVKQHGITAEPDIVTWKVHHAEGYVLVASDGVWDFLSCEEVSDTDPWLFSAMNSVDETMSCMTSD